MSFFGIGPSAKLLTVDVTYTNPTRTCVVKSSNHSESNSMNNIARETLPLITSGTRVDYSFGSEREKEDVPFYVLCIR